MRILLSKDDSNISKVLLFGHGWFNDVKSPFVLTASIDYILSTKGFDVPLYLNWHLPIFQWWSLFLVFIKKLLIFSANLYY